MLGQPLPMDARLRGHDLPGAVQAMNYLRVDGTSVQLPCAPSATMPTLQVIPAQAGIHARPATADGCPPARA